MFLPVTDLERCLVRSLSPESLRVFESNPFLFNELSVGFIEFFENSMKPVWQDEIRIELEEKYDDVRSALNEAESTIDELEDQLEDFEELEDKLKKIKSEVADCIQKHFEDHLQERITKYNLNELIYLVKDTIDDICG